MIAQFLHPHGWKPARGYANGMVAQGRIIVTGGMIGWNADCEFASDDFVDQTEQTLRNIVAVLKEADAKPEHLVRLTWYITSKAEYLADVKRLGQAYRRVIGQHYPAMAVVQVTALMEEQAKVEIEATAILPD